MGQFLIQVEGSSMLVTFPFASSLERGASIGDTEDWLAGLPPAVFERFANDALRGVRMMEGAVVWIPVGWCAIMVNSQQHSWSSTLAIPYVNTKLALDYPGIGILANFHLEHVRFHQEQGAKHWSEHGDSFIDWLNNFAGRDGDQIEQLPLEDSLPRQLALMDNMADVEDSQPPEADAEGQARAELAS